MKKKIIPLFVLLGTIGAYAQTGIGKALPDQSAELEVFSSDKGVLIPRLALSGETDTTTIIGGGNYPESLMVFNTGSALEQGFYYWSNGKWNALVSNSTLYKYIKETAKDGNVTITKNETGDDFTFTWVDKSTGDTKTLTLGDLVKKMETLTVLGGTNTDNKALLVYKDEGKVDNTIDLTEILKNSTVFQDYLKQYINSVNPDQVTTDITTTPKADGKRSGIYKYFNEKRADANYVPFELNVSSDVVDNFDQIINNGDVKNVLNKFFTNNPPAGTVTYTTNEAGEHFFKYIDKDGVSHDLNMNAIVKLYETESTLVPEKNNAKNTGLYTYTSEKGNVVPINVIEDVANNFDKVINNTEFKTVFEKYLSENVEGNVTYKNDKFYYTVKNGDGTFENKEISIVDLVKDNAYLSKLGLTNDANTDKVKGIFTFNDGKAGSTDVKYAETLTAISKGTESGKTGNFLAYNYKDETGANATAQITVTSDVINSFDEIIKAGNVVTELNKFISGATGSVTVSKDGNGDVVIGYKDGENSESINLTTIIKEKETLTSVNRYNDKGEVSNIATKPTDGFIFYEYEAEDGGKRYISVSKDVSNDFSKIINEGTNKTLIENIVTSTGGNASISKNAAGDVIITDVTKDPKVEYNITELIKENGAIAKLELKDGAVNKDAVKAGFTFNDGKAGSTDVSFAETLTKITLVEFPVYVYKEFDDTLGKDVYTYVENDKLPDDQVGNKVLINDYKTKKLVYENEKGDLVEVKGSDLFRQGTEEGDKPNGSLETLTSLNYIEDYKGLGPCLVYSDEESNESYIKVSDMFKYSETVTTFKIDNVARTIEYVNEKAENTTYSLDEVVQEPWYVVKTNENELDRQATLNTQDIYTQGWVGIGYDKKSSAPNEKLRVNGSITATNSYYADYVFESYFEGYSALKYDYSFKDLSIVSDFIEENRHLPGITPISHLEKTDMGYSFNVSELSIQLLEKTEELFLHTIEQQKEIEAKESRIQKLEAEMTDMTRRLEALEALLTK